MIGDCQAMVDGTGISAAEEKRCDLKPVSQSADGPGHGRLPVRPEPGVEPWIVKATAFANKSGKCLWVLRAERRRDTG